MGFDLSQVLSDDKHYSPFVCSICQNLVSLDCLVTNHCAHPFCRKCLEGWATTCRLQQTPCSCPACHRDIHVDVAAGANSNSPSAAAAAAAAAAAVSSCNGTHTTSATLSSSPSNSFDSNSMCNHQRNNNSIVLGHHNTRVAAHSLEEGQPLAFRVLQLIQVACVSTHSDDNDGSVGNPGEFCQWTGDYGDFLEHAITEHGPDTVDRAFLSQSPEFLVNKLREQQQLRQQADPAVGGGGGGRRGKLENFRSMSSPSMVLSDDSDNDDNNNNNNKNRQQQLQSKEKGNRRAGRLKESESLNKNDEQNDDDEDELAMASTHSAPPYVLQRKETLSVPSSSKKDALSSIRKKYNEAKRSPVSNNSTATTDSSPASSLLPLSASPQTVAARTSSSSSSPKLKGKEGAIGSLKGLKGSSGSNNNKRSGSSSVLSHSGSGSVSATSAPGCAAIGVDDSDLESSYSHNLDWNTSINSLGAWGDDSVNKEAKPMETLKEDEDEVVDTTAEKDFALQFEPENGEQKQQQKQQEQQQQLQHQPRQEEQRKPWRQEIEEKQQQQKLLELEASEQERAEAAALAAKVKVIFERAEKLKKQGNAKFNKGDFTAARNLYTEGIAVMSAMTAVNVEECELLSNMHSNRSVTFFREKKFDTCVEDCDKAIRYDPTYDKSWIRKWRALMALGNCDAAYDCLETAAHTIPESKRIQEELAKLLEDKMLLVNARNLLDDGDYYAAREVLKPHSRTSDNIALLYVAARADIGMGFTESALEKINKALRFNPSHVEGLELRGNTLFLAGDTEKGAHLLQEAYSRNKNNKHVKNELLRCQRVHSAFTKGRACVKRGRYSEACEHFTTAIRESGDVPAKAPLFGMLRAERAEAMLLSRKYVEGLQDCDEVLAAQRENATAWSVRAEIMIALGKALEAKTELEEVKYSWGSDNPTIDDAYRRVDFELRVLQADDDLVKFVEQLERGNRSILARDTSRERKVTRKGKSYGDNDEAPASPRVKKKSASKSANGEVVSPRVSRRQSMGAGPAAIHEAKRTNRRQSIGAATSPNGEGHRVSSKNRSEVAPSGSSVSSRRQIMAAGPGESGAKRVNRRQSMSAVVSSTDGANGEARSGERRRERRMSMSRVKTSDRQHHEEEKRRSGDTRRNGEDPSRSGSRAFVPPPSISDLTNGYEEKHEKRSSKDRASPALSKSEGSRKQKKSTTSRRT